MLFLEALLDSVERTCSNVAVNNANREQREFGETAAGGCGFSMGTDDYRPLGSGPNETSGSNTVPAVQETEKYT